MRAKQKYVFSEYKGGHQNNYNLIYYKMAKAKTPVKKEITRSTPKVKESKASISKAKDVAGQMHVCQECDKEFARLNRYRAHMHIHTGT